MTENESSKTVSRREFLTFSPLSDRLASSRDETNRTTDPYTRSITRLEELGCSVSLLSDNDSLLRVECSGTENFSNEQTHLFRPFAERIAWLDLGRTEVGNDGLSVLERMNALTRLHLEETNLTDAGLEHVGRLDSLDYLNLFGTNVTDNGLKHLLSLERIDQLYLWQTDVTQQGIQKLNEHFPNVNVHLGSST